MSGIPADYALFLARYNSLKKLYFSPKSDPQYDEDGEEIPSAHMSKVQITRVFLEEMRVHVPAHRQDPPRFLDGRVGPAFAPQPKADTPQVVIPSGQGPGPEEVA